MRAFELLTSSFCPRVNEGWGLRHVKLMQNCHWKFNTTALAQYR